jgi:hypothetical protein
MDATPVTEDRLRYIFANLWQRGVEELALLGMTPDGGRERYQEYANHSFKCGVLERNATPVAVLGISSDNAGAFTWFQATDEFHSNVKAITRRIRDESRAYPGPLSIYSVCVHPETERWYGVCGFSKDNSFAKALPSGAVLKKFDRR